MKPVDMPRLRHPFCHEPKCPTCLDDHLDLAAYLAAQCGEDSRIDWLSSYRMFCDRRFGRSAETEWGWADPGIFEAQHIEAFVTEWNS